jgi:hypothetical protein
METPYYRIRVDELNNGNKMYTPERAVLEVTRGWFRRERIYWEPLTLRNCETEEAAMEYIRIAKKLDEQRQARQVTSTTFKIIE